MDWKSSRNKNRKKKAYKRYKIFFKKLEKHKMKRKKISYASEFFSSKTLKFLYDKNFYKKPSKNECKKIKIIMPEDFSLIENPDKVFSILHEIVGNIKTKKLKEIAFDYSRVTTLDLGAVLLKNIICLNLEKEGVVISANFPGANDPDTAGNVKEKYKEAIQMIMFSGLFKSLGLNPKDYCSYSGEPLTLPLMGGGKTNIGISCKKIELGKVENDITENFNKALRQSAKKELNENGSRIFDSIIGEVIANCQEHSGIFNQYFCSSHYTQIDKNIGKYELSIFNLGQTIAEGIETSESLPLEVKERMNKLIEIHTQNSFFGKTQEWDREALLTLYSLQNKVSRKFKVGKKRGTGTVKMLQSFQSVGGSDHRAYEPKMTIISGNTQIIIDSHEICKLSEKQITFNREKTLEEKPNKKYVKKIKTHFPGTMISLSIYLDKKWLDKKLHV